MLLRLHHRAGKLRRMRSRLLALGAIAAVAIPCVADGLQPGTYRCRSYNVSGGGGSCRTFQPLVLHGDGSYRFSSTSGQWRVQDGRLVLSESKLWGTGRILGDGSLTFEYDYRGWHHVLTFTCQDCAAAPDPPPTRVR